MTTLGELLMRLQDRSELEQILANSGDAGALTRLDQIAKTADADICDAVLERVEAFTRRADNEAWVKLVGCLQNSPRPASACLNEIISWSLEQRTK